MDAVDFFCTVNVFIKVLAVGSHINIEDGGFHIFGVFFCDDGFFSGEHTAD
ncbi:MAG: hypothetical protein BWY12_01606 [candidate division BRC1 bacterium ADurb.Bin183]|nr:MAG: hypothetical protein BWY12_01606 [candidate division BRC1 bacterium ADurb.Bin183]